MWSILIIFIFSIHNLEARDENILMTEVFQITLNPTLFNWSYEGDNDQFIYKAALLNSPDLPQWINYVFSDTHHSGFLYGVPPNENKKVPLEIIALNRKNYDTRIEYLDIHISEKLNPAKYEVHIKIDNLNVDDIFNIERMENLKDIFRQFLWKESENDLYVTFLMSALELGARKPLNPNEGDGIVIRLGSQAPFSVELIDLQEEIKPLWKVPLCPRDFKRTSVERYFRNKGFALDWCSFRLIDDNNSVLQQSKEQIRSNPRNYEEQWDGTNKMEVPQRSYYYDFITAILVPTLMMITFAVVLSFILCFHHGEIHDPISEDFFNNLYHICTDYFTSSKTMDDVDDDDDENELHMNRTFHTVDTMKKFSNNRDISLSSDPILYNKNFNDSPSSTISHGVHFRPSPPPYIRPKFKPDF